MSFLKQYSYTIHRKLAWIVAVPTFLWALSGLMHPFMSHWFKTKLPSDSYTAEIPDSLSNSKSVRDLLEANKIRSFRDLHAIYFHGKSYLQVIQDSKNLYIDPQSGRADTTAELSFVEHIARSMVRDVEHSVTITPIDSFDASYTYVNRFLPVYKVSFRRSDAMDVYISATEGKFITFNDWKRKVFISIFSNLHTWNFLSFLPDSIRYGCMLLILIVLTLTAVSGIMIYGFFYGVFKAAQPEKRHHTRYRHRSLGLIFSFFVLSFSFSGAFHVYAKWFPNELSKLETSAQQIYTNQVSTNFRLNAGHFKGFGLVVANGICFQQQFDASSNCYSYFSLDNGAVLENGDKIVGDNVLKSIHKLDLKVEKCEWLTDFTHEYGFINKHLPVLRYQLDDSEHTAVFIDPALQKISAIVRDSDRREGFSFAFLHKFHFLDSLGKNLRDGLLVFFALGIAITCGFGLRLLVRK